MNAPLQTAQTRLAPTEHGEPLAHKASIVLDGAGDVIAEVATPDLVLNGDSFVPELTDRIAAAKVIVIDFPQLTDGRGYTHARVIRQELKFEGELRATGDVGVDQLHYLLRAGFSTFALRPGTDVDVARTALMRFGHHYVGVRTQAQGAFGR